MMRGASADAYAAAAEALPASGDLGKVAQDLFGISDLVRSEPGLRREGLELGIAPGAAKHIGGAGDSGGAAERDIAHQVDDLPETLLVEAGVGLGRWELAARRQVRAALAERMRMARQRRLRGLLDQLPAGTRVDLPGAGRRRGARGALR